MSCNISTTFQHVSHVGHTLLNSELEGNLKSFLDWGFLGIGGWFNVTIPTSGAWGGTFDQLRLVDDPSYTKGQVWEAPRKDWVWENETPYTGGSPVQITGVSVNGSFYGTGDATYAHHYNWQRYLNDCAIENPLPDQGRPQLVEQIDYRSVGILTIIPLAHQM